MWLARFGCRRRPMYRLMAAGCRFPRSSNSFELFRDRSAVKFPSPDADLDDNVSMPPKNQVAVAYFQDPPSVVKTCLALDTKTVVPLNAIVGSVSSVQPVGLSRDIFSDNAITRTSDTVTADLISQLKSSKHCGVGHGPGAGQSIFSRNLCGFPEQGENSKLPLCDDHNTQIEPPLDECKKYEIKTGNSKLLVEKIEEAIEENNRILDKSLLQKRFDLGMKPVLAPRLLLLPKDISDPSTRFLRDQYFLTNDKEAHFLSSYELTIHEKRIDDPEEWDRFMNMVISRRVFVVEDWESNVGNIETSYYYYGIKGAKNVSEFYRGEIDASFHDGEGDSLGEATLSVILWKGDKVIHAEVFEDIRCVSIHAAEAYAALALCFYCFENGIKDLELWTDNDDIHGAISGSLTVKGERKDRDVLLLLGRISTKFNRLISMNKRCEQLFLADDLAHSTGKSRAARLLGDYLNKWDYELRGKALFRLSRASSLNQIIKDLKDKPYRGRLQTKYFMEVSQLSKLEVISMIIETLCPSAICLAINHLEEKPKDFISQVEVVTGRSMIFKTVMGDCSFLQFGEKRGKELLIVVDATIPADCYNHLGIFTIILAGPGERALLDPRIEEASALTYVYFNGVLTGNRTGNAGQKKATGNAGQKPTGNTGQKKKKQG